MQVKSQDGGWLGSIQSDLYGWASRVTGTATDNVIHSESKPTAKPGSCSQDKRLGAEMPNYVLVWLASLRMKLCMDALLIGSGVKLIALVTTTG